VRRRFRVRQFGKLLSSNLQLLANIVRIFVAHERDNGKRLDIPTALKFMNLKGGVDWTEVRPVKVEVDTLNDE
jgi:hypothetical protein